MSQVINSRLKVRSFWAVGSSSLKQQEWKKGNRVKEDAKNP